MSRGSGARWDGRRRASCKKTECQRYCRGGDFWPFFFLFLIMALLAAPATGLVGALRPGWAAPVAVTASTLSFAAMLWGWMSGGGSVYLSWVPTLDLHLAVVLDGLAALYGMLATGIGSLVAL